MSVPKSMQPAFDSVPGHLQQMLILFTALERYKKNKSIENKGL